MIEAEQTNKGGQNHSKDYTNSLQGPSGAGGLLEAGGQHGARVMTMVMSET